jgi:amidase
MARSSAHGQIIGKLGMKRRDLVGALGASVAIGIPPPAAAPPGVPQGSPEEIVTYRSAADLMRALAAREISSRELVDAAIARIEAVDPKVNAVVVRDFDRARDAATAADAALARGETKPLLGLPMTVKEQFNVAGLPTTWGNPDAKGWQPQADALVVQRLKAAGAIILGKTNVPLMLSDWQSYNAIYGTTNNPWDLGRTPGGSSGGAAAALAAGYVPLELGSDIGGSLRAPAHYCGVFSHKPSLDLVPMRGAGPPRTPAVPGGDNLAVLGPMARTAQDLALELFVVAGPDELWDGIGYQLALPPPRHETLAEFRVLVLDEHPLCPTSHIVASALDTLAGQLGNAGCRMRRPDRTLPDLAFLTRNYVELLAADEEMTPDERARIQAAAVAIPPDDNRLTASYIRGATMPHPAVTRAGYIRRALRARWQALFSDVDVIICPPMPTPAFRHDHSPQRTRKLEINGKTVDYVDQIVWPSLATNCALPATTMPLARTEDGLPIGVQIIGPYLNDRTTIAFAGLVEREFGGFVRPPNL